jgi:hypothetical protein
LGQGAGGLGEGDKQELDHLGRLQQMQKRRGVMNNDNFISSF